MNCKIAAGDNSVNPASGPIQSIVAQPAHFSYQRQPSVYTPLLYPPSTTHVQPAVARGILYQYRNENVKRTVFHSSASKRQRHQRVPESKSHKRLRIDPMCSACFVQGLEVSPYNMLKNELIATACHSSRPVGTEQFTVSSKHNNNSNILKNLNRIKQSFHSNGFGQEQNHVMKPPTINEQARHSAIENNSCKNSPGTNKNNYRKSSCSTFRSKENSNRKRGRRVESVSEWIFPPGTKNKHQFVVSSLRQGIDPKIANDDQDIRKVLPSTPPSLSTRKLRLEINKKTKLEEKDKESTSTDGGSSNKFIHPVVRGAEFDNRFLKYELSLGGKQKKETLVRSLSMLSIPILNCSQAKGAWENNHMEEIPDEPTRAKTSSRIGPKYQARIPSKSTDDDTGKDKVDRSIPGYDILWDPNLAEEAERRGEDISGFLEGEHELCKQELLFSTLHRNGYRVEAARMDIERMQRLSNACSSSKFNKDEARQFGVLIHESYKDFSSIAKNLKRKRSDCLIHYYEWKVSNRHYQIRKKKWKSKYCSVCSDGGNLIICDGCNLQFHLECAKPPLSAVPEGDWFCHTCRCMKPKIN